MKNTSLQTVAEMPLSARLYKWRGFTADGQRVTGQCVAEDESVLLDQLSAQGIMLVAARSTRGLQRLDTRSLSLFMKQLATLLKAGVTIDSSLELLAEQAPTKLQGIITQLLYRIKNGTSLSASLQPHLDRRHHYLINMVRIGEESGQLASLLCELADQKEKQVKALHQLLRAATYPLILLLVAILVMALLLKTVVPQFVQSYSAMGSALPEYTQITLATSAWLEQHGTLLLVATALALACAVCAYRWVLAFRRTIAYLLLKLPLCGPIRRSYLQRFFASTVGLAYRAGVPLIKVVEWLPNSTSDPIFQNVLEELKSDLNKGIGFPEAVSKSELFGKFLRQMVRVGVDSGQLAESLSQIASYYDEQFDNRVAKLLQLMEPVSIGLIAAIVGWIIVTIYMPIFSLGLTL